MSSHRPRAQRAAPEQLPPFRLTDRDRLILKAICDCQVLMTRHVQTLFFASASPAYDRLHKLYHYGYLERHFISQVALAPATSPMVYTLAPLGAEVLAASFGYTTDELRFVTRQVLNWQTLQHLLAINDVRVAVMHACQQKGFELLEWRDERRFRANPDFVSLREKGGRMKRMPVLPDGYMHLKTPAGLMRAFLEVDRGTEGLPQVARQIAVYQEYMESGGYEARFGSRSLRILIVTNSARRLDSLYRTISNAGGGERYWLTTADQVTVETVVTEPIWFPVGLKVYVPLVPVTSQ